MMLGSFFLFWHLADLSSIKFWCTLSLPFLSLPPFYFPTSPLQHIASISVACSVHLPVVAVLPFSRSYMMTR